MKEDQGHDMLYAAPVVAPWLAVNSAIGEGRSREHHANQADGRAT